MTPDVVNGLFEFSGSLMLWANVRALYRDKVFKGVSMVPTAFFTAWGFWNLFYYPSLGQWWSFYGGCSIVTANFVWLAQMAWYSGLLGPRPRPQADLGCLCKCFPCECPR